MKVIIMPETREDELKFVDKDSIIMMAAETTLLGELLKTIQEGIEPQGVEKVLLFCHNWIRYLEEMPEEEKAKVKDNVIDNGWVIFGSERDQ